MTTSGTFTHDLSRDQIINRALRIIGVLDSEGGSASATQITNAAQALNDIVKSWNAYGLLIWTRNFLTVPLLSGKALYMVSPNTSDIIYQIKTRTTLSTAASDGAATVDVTDTTGIATGNGIGIQVSTGAIHWTTVNGAPSGNTVTLTTALDGAADQYAMVINGVKPSRVLKIRDGYIKNSSGNDIPINVIMKEDYNRFGVKTSEGTPTQIYYDAQLGQGVLYIYPVSNMTDATLFVEAETVLEDFGASGDTSALPQEWLNALVWNLAYESAVEYGVTEKRLQFIGQKAAETLNIAQWTSQENSVYFQPGSLVSRGSWGS